MLEKFFKDKRAAKKHLEAPMLKERDEFLTFKLNQGRSQKRLLSIADYLLIIVEKLNLTDDDDRKVSIQEIEKAATEWSVYKMKRYKRHKPVPTAKKYFFEIAFVWLERIGRLDDLYTDKENILNRLFCQRRFRIRYLTYPMLSERISHLEKWENAGAARFTLREMSSYQLHIIDLLHIDDGRMITHEEICKAANAWMVSNPNRSADANIIHCRENFMVYAKDWLSSMGKYIPPTESFPLKENVMSYLVWLKESKGYSQQTVNMRYNMLKNFMTDMAPVNMHNISPQTLDTYIIHRSERDGCSRRTIANTVSVLRDFFSFGYMKGWNSDILIAALNRPRTYRHEDIPSYVPWETTRSILVKKSQDTGNGIRDYAIFLLLAIYGLRSSEVTGLKLTDIDWRKEQIFIRRAKSGRPQIMPLLPVVGEAILRYIKEVRYNKGKCEYLFLGRLAPHRPLTGGALNRMTRTELRKAGVVLKHYGPHSFRHGCATQLINTGFSLKEIADLFGHVRLDTTRTYAKADLTTLREVANMEWEDLV